MALVSVAVDIYGGDYGPEAIIKGVLETFTISKTPFAVSLCGDKNEIERILASTDRKNLRGLYSLTVVHCPKMNISNESPSRVWKKYSNSSIIYKTVELCRSLCETAEKEGIKFLCTYNSYASNFII